MEASIFCISHFYNGNASGTFRQTIMLVLHLTANYYLGLDEAGVAACLVPAYLGGAVEVAAYQVPAYLGGVAFFALPHILPPFLPLALVPYHIFYCKALTASIDLDIHQTSCCPHILIYHIHLQLPT